MDQHPVPQNITGFQFKLIGDMTIKQFAFLGGGIILAYLSTIPSWPFILKWPTAFILGLSGFAFAFMPIEERSLDKWVVAFFRAVYAPTQYIWKKTPMSLDFIIPLGTRLPPFVKKEVPVSANIKLLEFLKSLPEGAKNTLDQNEEVQLKKLGFSFELEPTVSLISSGLVPRGKTEIPNVKVRKLKTPSLKGEIIFPMSKSFPTKEDLDKDLFARKITFPKEIVSPESQFNFSPAHIFTQIEESPSVPPQKIPLNTILNSAPLPAVKKENLGEFEKLKKQNEGLNIQLQQFQEEVRALQDFALQTNEGKLHLNELVAKYQEALKQRESAIEEITELKRKFGQKAKTTISPTLSQPGSSPRVQYVPAQNITRLGIPTINIVPNVISGMVLDNQNNILTDVIITIKDNEDNPVRAIKTNKIGQFKTITPLSKGRYALELEREGYEFDIIAIEVKDEVIPPIEIKAK